MCVGEIDDVVEDFCGFGFEGDEFGEFGFMDEFCDIVVVEKVVFVFCEWMEGNVYLEWCGLVYVVGEGVVMLFVDLDYFIVGDVSVGFVFYGVIYGEVFEIVVDGDVIM